MFACEGFVVEEVIRSGNDSIPSSLDKEEAYPCQNCPCQNVCADCHLSCKAFKQYATGRRITSIKWVGLSRIPTRKDYEVLFKA